jgi:hypothetical protein
MINGIKTSVFGIYQHLIGHLPAGFSFITGRMDYGTSHIIKHFVRSIMTGQPDDQIGIVKAFKISCLQANIIRSLQETMPE